jgi:hypothetical protein
LETKSKFEKDQKKALKQKKEEEEQEEASKNWKLVVELTALLRATLGNTLTALVAGQSNKDNIDGKLSDFKKDLFQSWILRKNKRSRRLQRNLMRNSIPFLGF